MLLDISLSLFALLCLCESGHYTLENKTGDGSLGADGSLGNMVFPEGAGLESLSLIIERANQSFIRMKSISTEADKAASEMEELINILQKFRVKDGSTGVATPTESDYPSTQLPLEEDVSSSGQLPESTTDESEEEAEDENYSESDYPSTQLPLEEDVTSSGQLPESTTDESEEEAEDTNYSESDYPSTQLPPEEDITSSGQLPESTTDESEEEAEDGTPYTTRPEGSTEPLTVFPEADDQALPFNCHYNFTSQQIPGNPKSTCATWLLDNYHKHKEGWRSCHDADYHRYDESGLFEKTTCSDYTSQCGSDQTDKACCAMVLCEIQRVTFFYQGPNKKIEEAEEDEEGTEPEEGPHDLATGACQDRYHHNLDNACVKWMFEHYHLVKTRFRWQRCSEFDYSKHSKKGCGKLKRQCEKAEAKQQSSANELCCASINCYGRRRHFLRLSG
ncbi:uncharacterized protein LOC134813930 [Bolinopsis microptera]|uniref:uncharacterized protein LOC134813930 n=1 Tax=Bolinopsis microptera TaxID=2820187 RepID=UPI003079A11C